MKMLYYDCFAGISGDMNLAAMIDLGVDKEYLSAELKKLAITGYSLKVTTDQRNGISGTRVDVVLNQAEENTHRNLSDIEAIIDESELGNNVKSLSKKIFMKLAEAEATVHNKSLSEIHFHEVGAIDSIIDIVGAAICYDHLAFDKIFVSTIELGGGFVTCRHGILPVPAPATIEILRGIPVRKGTADFETTTPTGAAIVACLADEFTDKIQFEIEKTAHGIGHKESGKIPNVLRVFMGELTPDLPGESDEVMIECTIDDMNPEWYDFVMERLFDCGAQEVFFTPVIMKKNRPGTKISVLCSRKKADQLKEILFSNTTTLGLRSFTVKKSILDRKFSDLDTEYGKVQIKSSYFHDRLVHSKPEYEDCRQIARQHNIPVREVYDKIKVLIESNRNSMQQ